MESPADIAKKIAETLNWKLIAVQETFDINEDKQGFFIVRLNPKKFLDTPDFKAVCALTRDLGGDGGYVKATRSWKVAGALAKKNPEKTPSKQETDRPAIYKESGNALPTSPYALLPINTLLSMPFQSRKVSDDSELGELAENLKALGFLQPIIVRQKAGGLYEVVAGERRVKAAQKAGILEVPALVKVLSDEEAAIIQLTENIQRKDLSEEEKTRSLGELAKRTHWTPQEISDHLKMSERWVYKYLPADLKGPEPEQLASARRALNSESQDTKQPVASLATQNVTESQDTKPTLSYVTKIPCAYCGEPVEKPVHLEGKFYHEDCLEQVKAEKDAGLVPEGHVGPFETTGQIEEEAEPARASQKPAKPEPLLTGYPWTCPDCGAQFIINHVDFQNSERKEHRLEACGQ